MTETKRNIHLDNAKLTRLDIVKNNANILQLIIISLYSLNNAENNFNVELIMNDCFIGEFLLT